MHRNILPLLSFISCALIVFFQACSSAAPDEKTKDNSTEQNLENREELIQRGEYLVGIMGCNDCHSPKIMGEKGPEIIPELALSGYPANRPVVQFDSKLIAEGFGMFYPDLTAAAGPWGVSFAANITPHETGIGNWSEEQFKRALKEGKAKGLENGRMLLPPMPWINYTQMSDADLHAVYTYLMSINPVENLVPQPIPPSVSQL